MSKAAIEFRKSAGKTALLAIVGLMATAGLARGQNANANGIAQRVAALEARIAALEAGGSAPPMWSGATNIGGCFNFGSVCGPYPYRLDREEFNTAAGYFSVPLGDPYGRITAIKAGYYRVTFSYGNSGTAVVQFMRNDVVVDEGLWSQTGLLTPKMDRILRLEAGDVLVVRYTYPNGSNGIPDANFARSRLQIQYLGE